MFEAFERDIVQSILDPLALFSKKILLKNGFFLKILLKINLQGNNRKRSLIKRRKKENGVPIAKEEKISS